MRTLPLRLWQATFGYERRQAARRWLESRLPDRWRYGSDFYAALDTRVESSMQVIGSDLFALFQPQSAVDVGCGNGWLLRALKACGCRDLQGLEYSQAGLQQTRKRGVPADYVNLQEPLIWPRRYEVCCCFEVAEHLEERYAETIVDSLVGLAPVTVFTAATPGQGGVNHVNEQPHEYWAAKFEARGRKLDRELTEQFRREWKGNSAVAPWYGNNVQVFRAQSAG